MNISFYLKNPDKQKSNIMMYLTFGGKRIRKSTGISIDTKDWDDKKAKVKATKAGATELNSMLERISSDLKKIYVETIALNIEPTLEYMNEKVNDYLKPKQKEIKTEYSFLDYHKKFIEYAKLSKGSAIIKSYRTTLKHLSDYAKHKKLSLNFDMINMDFYYEFVHYLATKKNLTNNTIGKYIKDLKVYMKYAFEHDLTKNTEFMKFKVLNEDSYSFALTGDEIQRIENLNLTKNKRFDVVRDLFLIMVYTSLRYSDLRNLKPENFYEKSIRIKEQKTKGNQIIAITPRLRNLLTKYPDLIIPIVSSQEMNRCLKEIGKLAGLDEPFQIIRYQGKNRIEKTKKKYELLTCHTARRTNITESLKKGVPADIVRKQSGHKSNKNFEKYIKMAEDDVVESMCDVWK